MATLVLTNDKVRSLTKSILAGKNAAEGGKLAYLRSLVARTQKELGASERERAGKVARLSPEGVKTQLAALQVAHEAYYAGVLEECEAEIPKGTPERAKVINAESNWARTALYAVRNWIRSGRDVTALAAGRVTKTNIKVEVPSNRVPSPQRLNRRVEKGVTELIEEATRLAAVDKSAAVTQLETAMAKIITTLAAIGGTTATRDAAKAVEEHIPFRTKAGVFYPVGVAS